MRGLRGNRAIASALRVDDSTALRTPLFVISCLYFPRTANQTGMKMMTVGDLINPAAKSETLRLTTMSARLFQVHGNAVS